MVPAMEKSPMIATTFEAAVYAGDLPAVTQFLRHGANVNETTSGGLSPLMIASGLGQASMVSLLLTAGADVRAVEPSMGNTALHKAACHEREMNQVFLPQPRPSLGCRRRTGRPYRRCGAHMVVLHQNWQCHLVRRRNCIDMAPTHRPLHEMQFPAVDAGGKRLGQQQGHQELAVGVRIDVNLTLFGRAQPGEDARIVQLRDRGGQWRADQPDRQRKDIRPGCGLCMVCLQISGSGFVTGQAQSGLHVISFVVTIALEHLPLRRLWRSCTWPTTKNGPLQSHECETSGFVRRRCRCGPSVRGPGRREYRGTADRHRGTAPRRPPRRGHIRNIGR